MRMINDERIRPEKLEAELATTQRGKKRSKKQEEVVVSDDVHLDFEFIEKHYAGSFQRFATTAYAAMKSAMIIPYCSGEDDWYEGLSVNTFLNRLLALPIELQGHIFRFCKQSSSLRIPFSLFYFLVRFSSARKNLTISRGALLRERADCRGHQAGQIRG